MVKRVLKATDRRRLRRGPAQQLTDTDGAGPALADLFNDRRKPNGTARRPK